MADPAIVGHGGAAPYDTRCSLVDATTGVEIAGFDAPAGGGSGLSCGNVNWTPDGSQALVSRGGTSHEATWSRDRK